MEFQASAKDGRPLKEPFRRFVDAVDAWHERHGYENAWWWPALDEALRKLDAPEIHAVLGTQFTLEWSPDPFSGKTLYEQLQDNFRRTESYTSRLIAAMKKVAGDGAHSRSGSPGPTPANPHGATGPSVAGAAAPG